MIRQNREVRSEAQHITAPTDLVIWTADLIRPCTLYCRYLLINRVSAPIEHPYTAMLAAHGPLGPVFPNACRQLS